MAVKWWGHGIEVLHDQFNPPRPSEPVPALSGPSTTVNDRTIARGKLDEVRKRAKAAKRGTAGKRRTTIRHGIVQATKVRHEFSPAEAGSGEEELEEQAMWDEDDVMLYFWGNAQVAKDQEDSRKDSVYGKVEERPVLCLVVMFDLHANVGCWC